MLVCLWAASLLHSQSFIMTNGNASTCAGNFYDSGGASGVGYSINENKTYTICSDGSSGAAIKINFTAFQLDDKDTVTVYDGNSNAVPVLGKFTKDDLVGLTLTASTFNTSGCLTFHFTSDNAVNGFWNGTVSCGNKCVFPAAKITSANNSIDADNIIKICPGNNITLDASTSTAGAGTISQYQWFTKKDTTTGPNYSASFPSPSGLNIELRVTNSSGCSNIFKEEVQVWVSTPPAFTGTTGDTKSCLNQQACFSGKVEGIAYKEVVPTYNSGTLKLPDSVGFCFTSNLNFHNFIPGQNLSSVQNIKSICVNIEHSYVDDLIIKITCPNGKSTILFNRGNGGNWLGVPNVNDKLPGTCGQYCWAPNAAPVQLQNALLYNGKPRTIPYGTYQSVQPFSNLIGCPLNGDWSFSVCDMQPQNSGFLCDWNIAFDPILSAPGISFTPTFNYASNDSTAWVADPTITYQSANGDSICAIPTVSGNKSYTYKAINDFGCAYDTTLSVKVYGFPSSDLPDTLQVCSSILQAPIKADITPNAEGSYIFLWKPGIGLSDSTIANPYLNIAAAQASYILQIHDNASPACITSDTLYIKKIPVPIAAFTVNADTGCVPLTIKMKDITNPKPSIFQWDFGDGSPVINSTIDSASHIYSAWGIDTIKHVIATFDGCTDTARKTIDAVAKPLVIFHVSPSYSYVDEPYFCFQNATEMGGNQWIWTFGNEGSSNKESDCFMFSDSVKCHLISLVSINSAGCTDTLKSSVCVRNTRQKIFAPNAFTPNNDNTNDNFTLVSQGISSNGYLLSIFDKWGNKIYETNTPNTSWDGNTKSSQAPMDVYVYKLQYKDEWGNLQQLIGSVTLIR